VLISPGSNHANLTDLQGTEHRSPAILFFLPTFHFG
jgi:hypothetical protein